MRRWGIEPPPSKGDGLRLRSSEATPGRRPGDVHSGAVTTPRLPLRHHHPLRRGAPGRAPAGGSRSWPSSGYTDVWSAEADGTDGFTPLALAAAWAAAPAAWGWPSPRPSPGGRPSWPRAWPPWPRRPRAGSPSAWVPPPRSSSSSGTASPSSSPTAGCATRCASCGPPWPARRSTSRLRHLRRPRASGWPGHRPSPRRIYVAALRSGMLRLAGREADGAILNWLSAEDVATGGRRGRPGQGDRGPHLRDPQRGRRGGPGRRPAHDHRLPQRPGLRRVPPLAGPGPAAPAHVGRLGGRGPQGAPWPPSPTRWWTT